MVLWINFGDYDDPFGSSSCKFWFVVALMEVKSG